MADAPTLSPEVSRGVSALARTLVAAARSWALYPPDHPAVRLVGPVAPHAEVADRLAEVGGQGRAVDKVASNPISIRLR